MAVARVRYRANNREFGKLMMGHQTQRLADAAAKDAARQAQALATSEGLPSTYVAGIQARLGPPTVLGGNLRRTARVVATDRLSAALEFGSGRRRRRSQKGHSPAYRILARAGTSIGNRRTFPGETRQINKLRGRKS